MCGMYSMYTYNVFSLGRWTGLEPTDRSPGQDGFQPPLNAGQHRVHGIQLRRRRGRRCGPTAKV